MSNIEFIYEILIQRARRGEKMNQTIAYAAIYSKFIEASDAYLKISNSLCLFVDYIQCMDQVKYYIQQALIESSARLQANNQTAIDAIVNLHNKLKDAETRMDVEKIILKGVTIFDEYDI